MNTDLVIDNIEDYLKRHQEKELLRFVAVGSVDDGKSTLIGRLLHDTHGIYEDQLQAVRRASRQGDSAIDFSLFTDGLKAEREQGITIDVAYRYFSTAKRKFIIADTPGHIQYTRNMATGASTADLAIILIDARLGVLQQSRRHAYIASLLGIPHLLVAVNKMDLRGYEQKVFDEIVAEFSAFARRLAFKDVTFIPISALRGDNVVAESKQTPWYTGGTVLTHLENVTISNDRNFSDFRYPVQYVLRPNLHYRGFAAEVASGVVKKGDTIMVLPSKKKSRVKGIDTFSGEIDSAYPPMSVSLRLEDEIDISRGDMLVHADNVPHIGRGFEATLSWMNERALDTGKAYLLKHTTQLVRANVEAVISLTNLETLEEVPAPTLGLNDIGRVRIQCHRPLYFDAYARNRRTGSFILIDSLSNNTVAAGMIIGPGSTRGATDSDQATLGGARSQVSSSERRQRLGHAGLSIWITGDGALGHEFAYALERNLFDVGGIALVSDVESSGNIAGGISTARASLKAGLFSIIVAPALTEEDTKRVCAELGQGSVLIVRTAKSATPAAQFQLDLELKQDTMDEPAAKVVALLESRGLFENS
jgi:sulfate adenylyltransferase large subunit